VTAEIFPKTDTLSDQNHLGNAINLPYFGEQRRAIDMDGDPIPLDEFVEMANALMIRAGGAQPESKKKTPQGVFDTGPPCIQSAVEDGPIREYRADWLYQMAVFAWKKYGDIESLSTYLMDWNQNHIDGCGEMTSNVSNLISSFSKDAGSKGYKCTGSPGIEPRCDKQQCMKMKHGIRGAKVLGFKDTEADVPKVVKLYGDTPAPQYIVHIYNKEIHFNSIDELTNLRTFINKVFSATDKDPGFEGKAAEWGDWIRKLLMAKLVEDETSQGAYLTLEDIVRRKYKALVKQRVNNDHNANEAHVHWWSDNEVAVPVNMLLEDVEKDRVSLGHTFNRQHIDYVVMKKMGCRQVVSEDDGEAYYVMKAWFEREDSRVKDQPYT
jgi:hypothetical protein